MNKTILTLILVFLMIGNVQAQFGRRVLNKDQSKKSFVKLVYHSMNDSVVSGYGFPDPTSYKEIIFTKELPKEATTRDWEEIKVKYVELYYNKLAMLTSDVYDIEYSTKKNYLTDTLKIYHLRNKGGGLPNGFAALSYENKKVRLFEDVSWEGYYVPSNLVYLQTKEEHPYESKSPFLNYNNHKAFKRSAKRVFKDCAELLQNIKEGFYFPKSKKNLKKLADDYDLLCLQN
jgi:hypothetical protein